MCVGIICTLQSIENVSRQPMTLPFPIKSRWKQQSNGKASKAFQDGITCTQVSIEQMIEPTLASTCTAWANWIVYTYDCIGNAPNINGFCKAGIVSALDH